MGTFSPTGQVGDMKKDIIATIIGRDEAKTLIILPRAYLTPLLGCYCYEAP